MEVFTQLSVEKLRASGSGGLHRFNISTSRRLLMSRPVAGDFRHAGESNWMS
jgi:hypothetical protein